MFRVLLRQPAVTEPQPLASGNSEIQLYYTNMSLCMRESVCVSRRMTVAPEGSAGGRGEQLRPCCPSPDNIKVLTQQPSLLHTHLSELFSLFFSFSHSIILSLSMPRPWIFSFSLYYSLSRPSLFLQNPKFSQGTEGLHLRANTLVC